MNFTNTKNNIFNPLYTVRYSNKAKYLQLRMSARGLEVIAPINLQEVQGQEIIKHFLEQKQDWIQKQWQQTYNLETIDATVVKPQLPHSIYLEGINQKWEVIYLSSKDPKLKLFTNPAYQLTLIGNTRNEISCLQKLRQWLQKIAQHHLSIHLNQLSKETDLSFNKVNIRNNTTRWGSCSNQKNISLCCKLLFLPPPLMRHILLHELCHTKMMNHGKKFWQLLNKFDEEMGKHLEALKRVQIPVWV